MLYLFRSLFSCRQLLTIDIYLYKSTLRDGSLQNGSSLILVHGYADFRNGQMSTTLI